VTSLLPPLFVYPLPQRFDLIKSGPHVLLSVLRDAGHGLVCLLGCFFVVAAVGSFSRCSDDDRDGSWVIRIYGANTDISNCLLSYG
jgi:hypothetical protein